ncbi:MAG: efflux RND transporter periplasmic adaptor subunit [candidate division Zixibacteria bacterium]|nr:efflux RND transporter periplasmic adaptor subunit [candidate division Zixibacteria bacterium]
MSTREGPLTETKPKLRPDLVVRAEDDGGRTVYVIKDPLSGRFFRLRAPEYYLLTRADGETSIPEAARQTNERFGVKIPVDAAISFFAKMERLLFFEGTALERARGRLALATASARRKSIWTIPIRAFDPDPLLTRWLPRLRLLFHPASIGLGCLLMLMAALTVLGDNGLAAAGIGDLWRLTSIPLFLLAVLSLALVHEFGHALTLKYYDGSVREMGFLLLYFQPCFYSNISDTYLLPGRRPRVYVGLAGIFFQGLATAVAIMLWRVVEPGNALADFLRVFTGVSLAIVLFNLNPLIKLDGYYLLVDLLRIPNLRAKAMAYWRKNLKAWFMGGIGNSVGWTPRWRRIFLVYGLGAATYTGLLVGWILYHLTRLVAAHWGPAGVAGLYLIILAFALSMRDQSGDDRPKGERAPSDSGNIVQSSSVARWRKPLFAWSSVILIVALLAIIKGERRVGSDCEVEAGSRFTITSPSSGTLESVLMQNIPGAAGSPSRAKRERSILQATASSFSVVAYHLRAREGDTVHAGDTVVVLSSNEYRAKLGMATADRDRLAAERNLLLSGPKRDAVLGLRAETSEAQAQVENKQIELERARQMWDKQLISKEQFDSKSTELEMAKAKKRGKDSQLALLISGPKVEELAAKDAGIAALEAQIDFLRTQIAASTIISPISGVVGRVERGGILMEIVDCDPVHLQLSVDENDIADVTEGAPVGLKVRALPFRQFHGFVTQIAADADTAIGQRHFQVTTQIANADGVLKPGMSGYAKIVCSRRSLLSLAARRVVQFFRVEFWSWW